MCTVAVVQLKLVIKNLSYVKQNLDNCGFKRFVVDNLDVHKLEY